MTVVLTVSAILFGVLAYMQLPVNDLPAVDYPVIQVNVAYPGASPETMANNVATPLERQFMQIPGLELVTSKSPARAVSTMTLQFNLDKSIDAAATDVQTAISAGGRQACRRICPARRRFSKTNPNDQPIMYIALYSDIDDAGPALRLSPTRRSAQRISIVPRREPGAGVRHKPRDPHQGRSVQARGPRDDDGRSGQGDSERHQLPGRRPVRRPEPTRSCSSRRASSKPPSSTTT